MSKIDQHCGDLNTRNLLVEDSEIECQICLYSPHPEITMVMISDNQSFSERWVPPSIVRIANQVVRAFKLNPSQVVWIEHTSARCDSSSLGVFHLINFEWKTGQASNPQRSPIHEDWYLSWLEAERHLIQPRS